jgi:hypothetical protein
MGPSGITLAMIRSHHLTGEKIASMIFGPVGAAP